MLRRLDAVLNAETAPNAIAGTVWGLSHKKHVRIAHTKLRAFAQSHPAQAVLVAAELSGTGSAKALRFVLAIARGLPEDTVGTLPDIAPAAEAVLRRDRTARDSLARELAGVCRGSAVFATKMNTGAKDMEKFPWLAGVLQGVVPQIPVNAEGYAAALPKSPFDPEWHKAVAPLISRFSAADFETHVLPGADRALKRSADTALPALRSLFAHLKLDTTKHLPQLLTMLTPVIKLENVAHRSTAAEILGLAVHNSDNADKLGTDVVDPLATQVAGASTLPYAYQRLGLIAALSAASRAGCSDKSLAPLAKKAVEAVGKYVEKEGNADLKTAAVLALGPWLARLRTFPDFFGEFASKLLRLSDKEKDMEAGPIRVACLQMLAAGGSKLEMTSITKLLIGAAQRSFSKPVLFSEGQLALQLLAPLAELDMDTQNQINQGKLWSQLFASATSAALLDIPAESSDHSVRVAASVALLGLLDDYPEIKANANVMATQIVRAMLHPTSTETRRTANVLVRKLLTRAKDRDAVTAALAKAYSTELTSPSTAALLPDLVRGTALALLPPRPSKQDQNQQQQEQQQKKIDTVALLCANHPRCMGARGLASSIRLRRKAARALFPALSNPATAAQSLDIAHLRTALTSAPETGLSTAKDNDWVEAGIGAIASLSSIPEVYASFMDWAVEELNTTRAVIAGYKTSTYGLFFTPEGQMFKENGEYIPVTVESKNKRRDKSQAKLYSVEDELWEEQVRRELEAKKRASAAASGKPVAAPPVDKKILEKIANESVVRAEMAAVMRRARIALEVVAALAVGNHALTKDKASTLSTAVGCAPFLRSPVLRTVAFAALHRIAMVLPYAITDPYVSYALAEAVMIAVGGEKDIYTQRAPTVRKVARLTHAAHILSRFHTRFPGPVFAYVMPIIEEVVYCSGEYTSHEHEAVLRFMASNVIGASHLREFPRISMVSTCLQAVAELALMRSLAAEMLVVLGKYADATAQPELDAFFEGLVVSDATVRKSVLDAFDAMVQQQSDTWIVAGTAVGDALAIHLWFARSDSVPEHVVLADAVWSTSRLALPDGAEHRFLRLIVDRFLSAPDVYTRQCGARAFAAAVKAHPGTTRDALNVLFDLYNSQYLPEPERVADMMGIIDEDAYNRQCEAYARAWCGRQGAALCFSQLGAPGVGVLGGPELALIFSFLIKRGLADEETDVRKSMLQAGIDLITELGKSNISSVLPLLENYIDTAGDAGGGAADRVREGVVIYLGGIARFLPAGDPKVGSAMDKLLGALRTPSEIVQQAVAQCMQSLVPLVKDQPKLVATLMDELLQSFKFATRVGAAYGLAGVIKGLGISSLKQYEVMTKLQAAAEDKKNPEAREGALLAWEQFCNTLGRLFEPYVIQILPSLLNCFADQEKSVQDAASATSRAVMGQLSAHGAKLVLPAILKGLEETHWRSKLGSVELLGAMAYCAPKTLSQCLPSVVPRLIEVLTDTNSKVLDASIEALRSIGGVIKNPEIQAHVPLLLDALTDPNKHTKSALDALVHTDFVHSIDAASLALIAPIMHRGLRERSTEVRKRTVQIVGSICSLADPKDVVPYVPLLLPEIKIILFDPIPEVRSFCANALGSLVKGMGEEHFGDLIPWLLDTLISDSSPVERSGAAQGIGEVIRSTGNERLAEIIPQVCKLCTDPRPTARDGAVGLFVFLPPIIGQQLAPHLDVVLPLVLKGLSDESEPVRETSLRAGRTIVSVFGAQRLDDLAPKIQRGVFDGNHRIRLASVQLLGDLLRTVAGNALGKKFETVIFDVTETAEEDLKGLEGIENVLLDVLGREKRDMLFAAIYITRSDVSPIVRQTGYLVWKSLVTHTTRLLREVLPQLMAILIDALSGSGKLVPAHEDSQEIASRCLGELVTKIGDRILNDIIPILQDGLRNPEGSVRQGVCLGLSEVLATATKNQLITYMSSLIPAVLGALKDELETVREAAARAFAVMHNNIGTKALDEILLPLLESLGEESEINARVVDGLKQLMAVKGGVVLPYLVPKLVNSSPISAFHARALATLVEVAGDALDKHVNPVVPELVRSFALDASGTALVEDDEINDAAYKVATNLGPMGAVHAALECSKFLVEDEPRLRAAGSRFLAHLCSNPVVPGQSEEILPTLIANAIRLFMDKDALVLRETLNTVDAALKVPAKEELPEYIDLVMQTVNAMIVIGVMKRVRAKLVPGFCQPKGIAPLVPMFLQGLMFGTPEMREKSAYGIRDISVLTDAESLKPFVTQMTGPLIRILGDRFPWQVKAAILSALVVLLQKNGASLKPFVPQLQTTFVKALSENAEEVRLRASKALVLLAALSPRVEQLVIDLMGSVDSGALSEDARECILGALGGIMASVGDKVSEGTRATLLRTTSKLIQDDGTEDTSMRTVLANIVGAYAGLVDAKEYASLSSLYYFAPPPAGDWERRHFDLLALLALVRTHFGKAHAQRAQVLERAVVAFRDDKLAIKLTAIHLLGEMLLKYGAPSAAESAELGSQKENTAVVLRTLLPFIEYEENETKTAVADAVRRFAKRNLALALKFQGDIVVALAPALKAPNLPVKLAVERAVMYSFDIVDGGFDGAMAHLDFAILGNEGSKIAPDIVRKLARRIQEEVWVESDDEAM